MKHAYLIVANANFNVVETCLKLLDDKRNDIYISIDKKIHATEHLKNRLKNCVEEAQVQTFDNFLTNWGGSTQLLTVMELLSIANNSGTVYEYIHFMQGSDLPIKTQDEIYNYFQKVNGAEFVQIYKNASKMAENKARYWHLFCDNRFFRKNKFVKAMNFSLVWLQKKLHICRNKDIALYQGSALFSITGECAKYLESRYGEIKKRFKYTLACDEVFIQSVLMDSPYKDKFQHIDGGLTSNARLIDRTRPDGKNSPHIWRLKELEYIMNQGEGVCFARKFDENVDMNIVNKIYDTIKKKDLNYGKSECTRGSGKNS